MQIGIDARLLAYRAGGISTYIRQLVHELAKIVPSDTMGIFAHRKDTHSYAPFKTHRLWTPPHHRIERLSVSAELIHHRLRLWHSPDFIPPYRGAKAHIITVHDLTFLHYPHHKDKNARRYYNEQIGYAVRHADHIFSVSKATKQDLMMMLHVPEEKITVQPNGINAQFAPLDDIERAVWQTRLNLPKDYILFVGTLEPRKNIPTLLNAYQRIPSAPPLVLVGQMGWLFDETYHHIQTLQASGYPIHIRHDITDEALPAVYNLARVLVMPSYYEGFGLPVAEAMACGTPVVASNTSSLPEVVGDAGLLFVPQDVDALKVALETALFDSQWRISAKEKGIAYAKQFTWAQSAQIAWSIYQNML